MSTSELPLDFFQEEPLPRHSAQSSPRSPRENEGAKLLRRGDEEAKTGQGFLIPVVLLVLAFCLFPLIWLLWSQYPRWRKPWQPGRPNLAKSHSCWSNIPGEEILREGSRTNDLQKDFSVGSRVLATASGKEQLIISWGEDGNCAQLLINAFDSLEYREPSAGAGAAISDPSLLNMSDGLMHLIGLVRKSSGVSTMYIDGFPVVTAGFPKSWPAQCEKEQDVQYHGGFAGTIEDLCSFDHALTREEVVVFDQSPHVFLVSTTSTTTSRTTLTATVSTSTTGPITTTSPLFTTTPPPTVTSSTSSHTTVTVSTSTSSVTTATSSTSTTVTTTGTSSSTGTRSTTSVSYTTTVMVLPPPVFSGGGRRESWDDDQASFVNAMIPAGSEKMSISLVLKAQHTGMYTDLLSWGTQDAVHGCVSLRLSPVGNLEYAELPALYSGAQQVWSIIEAQPELRLDDGEWHRVTVARSEFGIVYMYADAVPVGQDILQNRMPSDGLPHAKTSMSCGDEPGDPRPFVGVIGGFRLYDVALSAPEVLGLPESQVLE